MTETQIEELNMLSASLFGAEFLSSSAVLPASISDALKTEAINQAVYPLVQSAITETPDKRAYTYIRENLRNRYEHKEAGVLMTGAHVPYVILKGYASASYYPDPALRSMGDVDFLVRTSDFERASAVLVENGFKPEEDTGGIHVGFNRPPRSVWEMHRSINGGNEKVQKYLDNVIEDARESDGMMLPSEFHHCLILLCHTVSHMTSEGIGLRHLCDWAVFVNKVDVSRWQCELEDCGLWRFARVLSLVSAKYLHLPYQEWFGKCDDSLVDALMEDILASGNFGSKDADRTMQIKYISNRGEHTVDKKNAVMQVLSTISRKAEIEGKSRARVILDYAAMVLRGERKLDTAKTLQTANARKKLYSELGLFESK